MSPNIAKAILFIWHLQYLPIQPNSDSRSNVNMVQYSSKIRVIKRDHQVQGTNN